MKVFGACKKIISGIVAPGIFVAMAIATMLTITSCNKLDSAKAGHVVIGATLSFTEKKIDKYCANGTFKGSDCEEIKIRLSNVKKLHANAGEILTQLIDMDRNGYNVSMDEYTELLGSCVEAIDNIYDLARFSNVDLEKN